MKQQARILYFGTEPECRDVHGLLENDTATSTDDPEVFDRLLVEWDPHLVLILADGAAGMECVYRSRERRPCIPVFWFSDDPQFSLQSYRLDCAYFSVKPVTREKLDNAFLRCRRMGIHIGG